MAAPNGLVGFSLGDSCPPSGVPRFPDIQVRGAIDGRFVHYPGLVSLTLQLEQTSTPGHIQSVQQIARKLQQSPKLAVLSDPPG